MAIPFFTIVVLLDLVVLKTRILLEKRTWGVMAVMLIITAVFDQFLTGLPIVHYTEANMSGIRIGFAPIEDFSYTVAGVILIGSWIRYGKQKNWL